VDRNTIAGLLIVGVILIGFTIYNSNQAKQYQEERRIADSIARAEGRLLDPEIVTAAAATAEAQAAEQHFSAISQTADSIRRTRIGDMLVDAEGGEEEFHTFTNDVMELTFSTRGAHVYGVKLMDYSRYGYDTPLEMYVPGSSYFDMGFYLTGNNYHVSTREMNFQFAGVETIALPENRTAQRILFRLPVDTDAFIQYAYTILSDDYMVDFDVEFVGMQGLVSPQMPSLMLAWGNTVPQQEKGFENENNHSTVVFRAPGDDNVRNIGYSTGNRSDNITGSLQWIAQKQQFFTTVLVARNNFQNAVMGYETFDPHSGNLKKFHAEANVAFARTQTAYSFQYYFGPVRYSQLKQYDMRLERLVNMGWKIIRWVTTGLVIPIFNFLSIRIASMGLVILILTFIIKIIILPLTYKSYLSTAKMRLLKPQLEEINKQFPNREDAMKKQQATMALYKQTGVSPMGGCLPMLVQMPILMSLFFFFPTAIELRGQSFLWAEDLSTYDSVLNLPFSLPAYGSHVSLFTLLMAASLFLTTKLSQQSQMAGGPGAGMMKMMLYVMPAVLLLWFNNFASGLTYYYFLSNLMTIGQTYGMKFAVNDEKLHDQMKAYATRGKGGKKAAKPKSKWQQRLEEMQRHQREAIKEQQKKRR